MLTAAVLVFAVGALGGVVLALHVLRGKFAPWALSVVHALLGATGLSCSFCSSTGAPAAPSSPGRSGHL